MTRSRRIALLAAIVWGVFSAAEATASAGHTTAQSASLVLDWYPNSDHAGIYSAIQRGFFARRHVTLKAYTPSDTSAQIPLVAAGRADFGITYETDTLIARARGIPVRSVMCIMQHPLNTVMTLRSSGITRPRQLAGKTVGMAGSPSDIPIISTMVKRDGASMKNVHTVTIGYDLLTSLLGGKVDAVVGVYWTWEAILAQERGRPVNVMRVEKWGVPNNCELVLIAGETTIRNRASLVRAVVAGMQDGYAYASAHPRDAWAALHAADPALKSAVPILRSLALLDPVITGASTIGYQDATQWRHYAAWLYANKIVSRAVDSAAAFTNDFLLPHIR
jgi:putative hydroxymethylpyrimidine transport system substrate-binding protein